ncbi:hypothetical protein KOW79_001549 [Hemibagrus wyckioides]|uniref:Uncharacterized protein n=1 Tax=Hemibagrus wyckioides TaxID=337641 RepID=A0A9D3SXS4_9TELE|nr:hypothetical protein KOW79_001549 [Hemibagrus wyckioides]
MVTSPSLGREYACLSLVEAGGSGKADALMPLLMSPSGHKKIDPPRLLRSLKATIFDEINPSQLISEHASTPHPTPPAPLNLGGNEADVNPSSFSAVPD